MFQADKSLVLAKIEANYGVDPVPAEATEAIITKGVPTFDVVGAVRSREVPMPTFGRIKGVNVGDALKLSFTTELKHSGTAGSVSRYNPLFLACGMTAAVGATVVYTPGSTMGILGVTLYFYVGGVLHKIIGAVGTFKLNLKAGEIATVDWEFTGLYADNAADVAFPTATHEAIAPLIVSSLGFTYGAFAAVIEELVLDIGNTVSPEKSANAANNGVARYFISNRESKGTMNPEAGDLTDTFNPWDIYDQTTAANIALDIGGSAGNDFAIAVTGAVLEAPKYGSRENILTWDLSFTINPTLAAGNNEIVITFK